MVTMDTVIRMVNAKGEHGDGASKINWWLHIAFPILLARDGADVFNGLPEMPSPDDFWLDHQRMGVGR